MLSEDERQISALEDKNVYITRDHDFRQDVQPFLYNAVDHEVFIEFKHLNPAAEIERSKHIFILLGGFTTEDEDIRSWDTVQ